MTLPFLKYSLAQSHKGQGVCVCVYSNAHKACFMYLFCYVPVTSLNVSFVLETTFMN